MKKLCVFMFLFFNIQLKSAGLKNVTRENITVVAIYQWDLNVDRLAFPGDTSKFYRLSYEFTLGSNSSKKLTNIYEPDLSIKSTILKSIQIKNIYNNPQIIIEGDKLKFNFIIFRGKNGYQAVETVEEIEEDRGCIIL